MMIAHIGHQKGRSASSSESAVMEQSYYQKFYEEWMRENAHKFSEDAPTASRKSGKSPKLNVKFEAKRDELFEARRNARVVTTKTRRRKEQYV